MTSARTWMLVVLGLLIGVPVGSGVVTFVYADGLSYLAKDPRACVNCHVMQSQFDAWEASSHRAVATCNDCHTQGSVGARYMQKAVNGFLHSFAFTTGRFHEPIRIKGFNHDIALRSCVSCHTNLIESSRFNHRSFGEMNCLTCHREAGHRKW